MPAVASAMADVLDELRAGQCLGRISSRNGLIEAEVDISGRSHLLIGVEATPPSATLLEPEAAALYAGARLNLLAVRRQPYPGGVTHLMSLRPDGCSAIVVPGGALPPTLVSGDVLRVAIAEARGGLPVLTHVVTDPDGQVRFTFSVQRGTEPTSANSSAPTSFEVTEKAGRVRVTGSPTPQDPSSCASAIEQFRVRAEELNMSQPRQLPDGTMP